MLSLAIFGGTFDPIHQGHLKICNAIENYFNFDSVFFVPCKIPLLKTKAQATNQQRIDMLQLALSPYPKFRLDLRELERESPSYMIDTLKSFRKDYPQTSLTLIIGYDAWLTLPQWHQWQSLINFAHILVVTRGDNSQQELPDELNKLLRAHETQDKAAFLTQQAGCIMHFNAGDYEISSTQIREDIKLGKDVAGLVPEEIRAYIIRNKVY
ncbi:MAG: nicotinate-nucleotide adenylyltransferase [Legionella sp.]|jgi:nicotinate-nucleotide adenylyltransferase